MPVTVTLYVPGGVPPPPPPFPVLMPLPHADHVIPRESTQRKMSPDSSLSHRLRDRLPEFSSTSPDKPERVNHNAQLLANGEVARGVSLAEVPAVVTVTVIGVAVEPLSLIEFGESEHPDCAGAPLHPSVTV